MILLVEYAYVVVLYSVTMVCYGGRTRDTDGQVTLAKLDEFVCLSIPKTVDSITKDCALLDDQLSTIIASVVIFRHGPRNPLYAYPNDPLGQDKESEYGKSLARGLGQLTREGPQWSYHLGQFLRCRYAVKGGLFLSDEYVPAEIYARSSETDRTMATGQAVLAGLYPTSKYSSEAWQPIPISTINTAIDNKLQQTAPCPRFDILQNERMRILKESFSKNRRFLALPKLLQEYTGANVDFDSVSTVFDTILVQRCLFGLEYPPWFPPLAKDMFDLSQLVGFQNVTEEIIALKWGPMLQEIHDNFQTALGHSNQTTGKRKAKLFMYSAHDGTLSSILSSLGVYNINEPPPFNAMILIELYTNSMEPNNPSLMFFYRTDLHGLPVELKLPFCEEDTPCSLQQFYKGIGKYSWEEEKWSKQCGFQIC